MVSQSCRHARCALLPLGTNQSGPDCFPCVQLYPQTLMRAHEGIKGVKEDDSSAHLLPVFAEAAAFSDERSTGMTQGQVEPLTHTGAERQATRCEAVRHRTARAAARAGAAHGASA